MNSSTLYTILFCLFLLWISVESGFAQNNREAYVDSVLLAFDAEEGEEKAHLVANFIRNTSFHEVPYQRFVPYIEEAYAWEADHKNPRLLNTLRLGHVSFFFVENDLLGATKTLVEILQSGEPIPKKDSVSAYTFLFGIYLQTYAYSEAWEVLKIRENILSHNEEKTPFYEHFQLKRLADVATIYLKLEEEEKAIVQYKRLIVKAQEKGDLLYEAGAFNNLGLTWLQLNEPDSAILYFNRTIEKWKIYLQSGIQVTQGNEAFLDVVSGNIGHAYNIKGQFRRAIPMLEKDLISSRKLENLGGMAGVFNELGLSYLGLKNYPKALQFLDSADALMKGKQWVRRQQKNLEIRVELLEQSGAIAEAFQSYKKLVAFNDSLDKVRNQERLAVLEVVYEVGEKNKVIVEQNLQALIAENKAEKQLSRLQILLVGSMLMFVIVVSLVAVVIQRRKRNLNLAEKNHQIAAQNEVIEQSLVEKETLLKEIHHRVKNNLQLISGILELQASSFEDQNVRDMVEEGQGRVRSMALIHQQLYQSGDLGRIEISEYLDKLTKDIAIAFKDPEQEIEMRISTNGLYVDVNVAVPLGLIVNELITNSFKHGFKGQKKGVITIEISARDEEIYELMVGDDGNGLPADFDPAASNSLGLRLVKGLSRQLQGNYRVENGTGTRFFIQFNNNHMG